MKAQDAQDTVLRFWKFSISVALARHLRFLRFLFKIFDIFEVFSFSRGVEFFEVFEIFQFYGVYKMKLRFLRASVSIVLTTRLRFFEIVEVFSDCIAYWG